MTDPESISKQKKQMRERFLNRRNELNPSTYRKFSAIIARTLLDQDEYQSSRVIHCYISMNERHEVETHALIKRMMQEGKKVVVPKVHFEERTMQHIHLTSFDRLEKNKWDIWEPSSGPGVYPKDLDMVIVPMAGGDTQLNRIGYGGGFYDRFLEDLDLPRVGLTFECCVKEKPVPAGAHDVPLTKIITEERVIT